MISPAGHGHAPHTQTTQPLMAQPCSGTTVGTDTAGSVGSGKLCHTERGIEVTSESFSKTYCAIRKLWLTFPLQRYQQRYKHK